MTRIRNLLPGPLHIPEKTLRIPGNGIAIIEHVTSGIQAQIDAGRVAVVTGDEAPAPAPAPAPASAPAALPPAADVPAIPDPPADFETLGESDAIEYVEDETDAGVIQSILNGENRPGVLDALKTRLAEISRADK